MECAIDEKKAAVDAATTALAQAQDTLTQAQNSDNSASQAVSTDLTYIKAQIEAERIRIHYFLLYSRQWMIIRRGAAVGYADTGTAVCRCCTEYTRTGTEGI